jgi:phosphoribosylglycinamide formyltransferase 2
MKYPTRLPQKILLLGSGELGKELAIAAQRLGNIIIAVDRYPNAPAMHVSDFAEVISILDGGEIERIVEKYRPDIIVPEVETIPAETLLRIEKKGISVVPTATAVNYTIHRDKLRDLAHYRLKIRTAKYTYATSLDSLKSAAENIGFPNVVKPIISYSGKGHSVVKSPEDLESAWYKATQEAIASYPKVIVEEFIDFEFEMTLLAIQQWNAPSIFCPPIATRSDMGDYRESWQPAEISPDKLRKAHAIANKVMKALGGRGIFGIEFFITKHDVIFSEVSPGTHDTGMVTLISQNLNEFELQLRAMLGLPIPKIQLLAPSASTVILARDHSDTIYFDAIADALSEPNVDLRLFGKPDACPLRRLGVALARGATVPEARRKAQKAANQIKILNGA